VSQEAAGRRPGTWEDDLRDLAALEADFGRYYGFGFDRDGWEAWPGLPHAMDLRAATALELRDQVTALLPRGIT
jgi:hypothetical protein